MFCSLYSSLCWSDNCGSQSTFQFYNCSQWKTLIKSSGLWEWKINMLQFEIETLALFSLFYVVHLLEPPQHIRGTNPDKPFPLEFLLKSKWQSFPVRHNTKQNVQKIALKIVTESQCELLSSTQTCLILVFAWFLPFFLSNFSNKVSSSESWHLLYNFSSYKFCCVTFGENENKFWCQVQSRGTTEL